MNAHSRSSAIAAINAVGQSIWYDNLSRDVLTSGHLKSLIDQGVSGLTSNPTIFKKAIADSTDYDQAILALRGKAATADALCEELFIQDVGAACDLLRPVYDTTNGADGYGSLEVSPELAHSTEGTLEAARRLWSALKRPNLMIKVPATPEGIPAIQQLISEGINVNVTLIFSAAVYDSVMEAYLAGLESRAARGLPVKGIASVASFFVSRVDSIVEKTLAAKGKSDVLAQLIGKIGIANCRVAYQHYLKVIGTDRWKKLAAAGAQVQRPLWASTGTKNPAFSPVLYVEALVGKDTVNTVPPATLDAIFKGVTLGQTVADSVDEASRHLGVLEGAGVDLGELLLVLQREGVQLFKDSYRELIASIESKRDSLA
jgi:transaldolase